MRGFTLLEVLIALLILSISYMALATATGDSILGAGYLEEKTLASIVAQNRLAEIKLAPFPAIEHTKTNVAMAGREWEVATDITDSGTLDIRKISITVRGKSASTLYRLQGFAGRH